MGGTNTTPKNPSTNPQKHSYSSHLKPDALKTWSHLFFIKTSYCLEGVGETCTDLNSYHIRNWKVKSISGSALASQLLSPFYTSYEWPDSQPRCPVPAEVTCVVWFGWAALPVWTLPLEEEEEEEEAEHLPSSHSLKGAEPFLLPTHCSHVLETPDSIFPMTHKHWHENRRCG